MRRPKNTIIQNNVKTVISILALTTGNSVYLISTKGSPAGVTGQQRMLTPPRHPILPWHLSKVRVALHSIL
jgi:hypothetical protein